MYSNIIEDHLRQLERVVQKLKEHGLKMPQSANSFKDMWSTQVMWCCQKEWQPTQQRWRQWHDDLPWKHWQQLCTDSSTAPSADSWDFRAGEKEEKHHHYWKGVCQKAPLSQLHQSWPTLITQRNLLWGPMPLIRARSCVILKDVLTIMDKPVFYISWYQMGISHVNQIVKEQPSTFLSPTEFESKYHTKVCRLTKYGMAS